MAGERPAAPRKILMTADAVGGVWQYAVDLSTALAETGTEMLIATLGPAPSAEQLRAVEPVPGVAVVHGNYALEWMDDAWADVDKSGKWLQEQQRAFGADIVHLNGFSHASLEWDVPVLCAAHSCVRSWWQATYRSKPDGQPGSEPGDEWAEYTRRVKGGLEASSLIATPTAAMGRSLMEEYGVPAEKIRVIHNATRMPEYDGKQKEAFILAAGRMWDGAKNFKLLGEVAGKVDWPIRVAGDGQGFGEGGHLQKLGKLPHSQLGEQLRRASIFAHPALYEPFGLSVLEAARSRCCLALSNISSLRELWEGAAVFLDPLDSEAWAFELNELSRDFPRRRRLGDLAAKRARRYSSEAMLAGYLDLYASLSSSDAKAGVAA